MPSHDSVEACKIIRQNYLTGNLCTPPLLAHAEVRLAMLASAEPGSTRRQKSEAARQVKAMLRQGRKIRDSGPSSHCASLESSNGSTAGTQRTDGAQPD